MAPKPFSNSSQQVVKTPPSSAPPNLEVLNTDQVSRSVLTASIDGMGLEDVKFFAFSRRTRKGKVCAPVPLYGNTTCIRKTASHFDAVLTQGFAESIMSDLNSDYPADRPKTLDQFDYTSDSDLDDIEDDEAEGAREPTSLRESEMTERDVQAAEESAPDSSKKPTIESAIVSGRHGRVIFLDDVAHRTWRALLYYSYFESISFAPLQSQKKRSGTERTGANTFTPPQCSPKSMYRLADKYGIEQLKLEAASDIESKLTSDNICTELFSTFTSLYPEIQEIEVRFLYDTLTQKDSVKGLQELPVWLEYLSQGRLPAGSDTIVSLLIAKLATRNRQAMI